MLPRYPFPWKVAAGLAGAILFHRRRSFRKDSVFAVASIRPPMEVSGQSYIPQVGRLVVLINHYHRPGFGSWWMAMAVSAVIPLEIHWVTSEAWTSPGWLYSHTVTPVSRWLFRRMAQVYSFTSMPPMPPRPWEVARRAQAVRQVLSYAKKGPQPVIGLAPEGGDSPTGELLHPPEGFGRFLLHLTNLGLALLPVGVYEDQGCLHLHFGPQFSLDLPDRLPPLEIERLVSRQVMERIAALLPLSLRGEYSTLTDQLGQR